MRAATPAFTHIEEAFSASCDDEEVAQGGAPPAQKRGFWKAVAAASTTLLVAATGTWYARAGMHARAELLGAATTGLAGYSAFPSTGCQNWVTGEISRSVVNNKEECAALCDAEADCLAYDWQATACEPGWYQDNGCLLLKETCDTHTNACWELNVKTTSSKTDTEVTQVLTILTNAKEKEVEDAVTKVLATVGITPVVVDGTEVFMGRLLEAKERQLGAIDEERTWDVEWEYYCSADAAATALAYANKLSTDKSTIASFKESLLLNLPEKTIIGRFKAATPSQIKHTTSEAPPVTTEAA